MLRASKPAPRPGVLNSVQQLAGALGVAITRCLLIEAATTPVLLALTFRLPMHPRPDAELTVTVGDESYDQWATEAGSPV